MMGKNKGKGHFQAIKHHKEEAAFSHRRIHLHSLSLGTWF